MRNAQLMKKLRSREVFDYHILYIFPKSVQMAADSIRNAQLLKKQRTRRVPPRRRWRYPSKGGEYSLTLNSERSDNAK